MILNLCDALTLRNPNSKNRCSRFTKKKRVYKWRKRITLSAICHARPFSDLLHHLMHSGHKMLLTTLILLPLLWTVVTVFCSSYYVSECPLRQLLCFRPYITPHR
jgi:polyferredoxin